MFRVVIVYTPVLILAPITATTIISVTCSSALVCIATTTLIPTAISVGALVAFPRSLWDPPVAGVAICPSLFLILAFATDNPVFRSEINFYFIENRIAEDAGTRSLAPLRLAGGRGRSRNGSGA
jgi:hypothetical protein